MSDDLSPIWSKLDEHGKKIEDHEVRHKMAEQTIDHHDSDLKSMRSDNSEQFGAVMTELKIVTNDYHQRQGSARITSWLIPTLIAAIGALISYISLMS